MALTIHDTFRGEKVPFKPANAERITVYCCGPTVYAPPHIGNARAAVTADMAVRVLRHQYGQEAVIFARNYTDIDDKIIAAAAREGVPIDTITDRATKAYMEGLSILGCVPPDLTPRATAHIADMQNLVSALLTKGHAYAGEGHILFDAGSFAGYGALSRLERDDILAGARVEIAPYKKDAADFVLWKPAADDEPGWEAPAIWPVSGRGRPGWHLECSAMIAAVLGETIDLHLGGQDLRFPHHENEIAQSCCALEISTPLARHWMHNGMLRLDGEKMSKSAGNIETPQELATRWPGEVLRLALLSAQYRQPLDWTDELLVGARRQLDRFYRALDGVDRGKTAAPDPAVVSALMDDFNTPGAIAALHDLRDRAGKGEADAGMVLLASGRLLGLFGKTSEEWFRGVSSDGPADKDIEALIAERADAKASRNFARADAIREELAAQGIALEDGAGGVTWRRV